MQNKTKVPLEQNGGHGVILCDVGLDNLQGQQVQQPLQPHQKQEQHEAEGEVSEDASSSLSPRAEPKNIMELLLAAAAKRDNSNKQDVVEQQRGHGGHAEAADLAEGHFSSDPRRNHGGGGSVNPRSQYRGQQPSHNGGIAKAASMSELEASQLEPDHNQHLHHTK